MKYQDRILFGKDSFQPDEYPYYWRVFETADEYFDYYRDYHAFWKLYGMGLPDAVLKKLYYQNALRVVKGLPRPAGRSKARAGSGGGAARRRTPLHFSHGRSGVETGERPRARRAYDLERGIHSVNGLVVAIGRPRADRPGFRGSSGARRPGAYAVCATGARGRGFCPQWIATR